MTENITITYFDTAMILLEADGVRLLTDPVLDPAGTVFDDGSLRLEKTSDSTISAEQLGQIDAVLLSHDQHGDNLDNGGRELLGKARRVLTTPAAAARLGQSAEGLTDWEETEVEGTNGRSVRITAVPAQHGPEGTQEVTGPVTGFLVQTMSGARIYISGDTILFSGTDEIARRFAPVDIAVLHLGRVRIGPFGDMEFSLSAEKAIRFAESLEAKQIVPVHFEGWKHFSQNRQAAQEVFAESPLADRTTWLRAGESAEVEAESGRADA